jgi:hypothetical protein
MWDRRGRDRIVVRFTTTYAISGYQHLRCVLESRSECQLLLFTISNNSKYQKLCSITEFIGTLEVNINHTTAWIRLLQL